MFGPGNLFLDSKLAPVVCCFTADGCWCCPVGAQKVVVVTIGAGGGGGGGITPAGFCLMASGAGAGGGGGVTCCELTGGAIPCVAAVLVGAGGGGGATTSSGSAGGSSNFSYIGDVVCAGGGAGGAVALTNLSVNVQHCSLGGAGGTGNFLNGGLGGCGFAFSCPSCGILDLDGRTGTFPTTCGGNPGGAGGGFKCPSSDGARGAGTGCQEIGICGVDVVLGNGGQGSCRGIIGPADNGGPKAGGGGGGSSPGNFTISAGKDGAVGFVFVKSFY